MVTLFRDYKQFKKEGNGLVATIGNFDGLHLGHQAILNRVSEVAAITNRSTLLILFEPSPEEFFAHKNLKGRDAPGRLMTLRDKIGMLKSHGISNVLCLRFNEQLANFSPAEFIEQILWDALDVRYLIVGDDFRFGKDRKGDFNDLNDYALKHSNKNHVFQVEQMPSIVDPILNQRISSSLLRKLLREGNLKEYQRLTQSYYTLSGKVIHGEKRGRALGFATANLPFARRNSPLSGVYSARLSKIQNQTTHIHGVVNIGTRPSVGGIQKMCEIHLFDFNQELYGKRIEIELIHKIRDEQKFQNLNALKAQIARDVQCAMEDLAKEFKNEEMAV